MLLLQDRIRSFKQPCRESGGSAVQSLQRLERSDLTSGERRQLARQANNYDISSCSPQAVLHLIRIQIWLSCRFFFFFFPCSLGNSSEKLGRYRALTVWRESPPSQPLCFSFNSKYPSVTVFCKPIIHLRLLKKKKNHSCLAWILPRYRKASSCQKRGARLNICTVSALAVERHCGSTTERRNTLHPLNVRRTLTGPGYSRQRAFPKTGCLSTAKNRTRLEPLHLCGHVWVYKYIYIYVEGFGFCVQIPREESEFKCGIAGICISAALTRLCARSTVPYTNLITPTVIILTYLIGCCED